MKIIPKNYVTIQVPSDNSKNENVGVSLAKQYSRLKKLPQSVRPELRRRIILPNKNYNVKLKLTKKVVI